MIEPPLWYSRSKVLSFFRHPVYMRNLKRRKGSNQPCNPRYGIIITIYILRKQVSMWSNTILCMLLTYYLSDFVYNMNQLGHRSAVEQRTSLIFYTYILKFDKFELIWPMQKFMQYGESLRDAIFESWFNSTKCCVIIIFMTLFKTMD